MKAGDDLKFCDRKLENDWVLANCSLAAMARPDAILMQGQIMRDWITIPVGRSVQLHVAIRYQCHGAIS